MIKVNLSSETIIVSVAWPHHSWRQIIKNNRRNYNAAFKAKMALAAAKGYKFQGMNPESGSLKCKVFLDSNI